jgi:hypothetical protein
MLVDGKKGNEDGNNTKVSTVAATVSRKESSCADVAVQKEKACKQKGKVVATKQNEAVEVNVILSYFSFFAYTIVFVATKYADSCFFWCFLWHKIC